MGYSLSPLVVAKQEIFFKRGAAKYNNIKKIKINKYIYIYIYILIPKEISNGLNSFKGLTSKVSTFEIED